MKFFITGTAGFVGYHLAQRLLDDGHEVTGFDALTEYYGRGIKLARHARLARSPRFRAVVGRLEDADLLARSMAEAQPQIVVHLAAQAGVRHSLEQPMEYVSANLAGTLNLLAAAAAVRPQHLLYASSSSVYGGNVEQPFAETHRTGFPMSVYAATKSGAEALTHAYAHLNGIATTCFRFFTVYGPWGRPDMALFRFVEAIERGEPIEIYGGGKMARDFTYVGDLVEAIVRLTATPPILDKPIGPADSLSPVAPWRVVNIAAGRPVGLLHFISAIEAALDRTAIRKLLPMQPGDVVETSADTSLLKALVGELPATPLAEGVAAFVQWYRSDWASLQT
ncbi:MAG: NAD-dependent epimerase/dehydratase family protein [Devosia sp.]